MFNRDCRSCGEPLTEANTYPRQKAVYDYECRTCKRARSKVNREKRGQEWLDYRKSYNKARKEKNRCWNLRNNYGISLEEWEKLFQLQGSKCKICETETPPSMGWHTDHNHKTGKVRGILCHLCNTGLGKFKEDIEVMKKAIGYLEEDLV